MQKTKTISKNLEIITNFENCLRKNIQSKRFCFLKKQALWNAKRGFRKQYFDDHNSKSSYSIFIILIAFCCSICQLRNMIYLVPKLQVVFTKIYSKWPTRTYYWTHLIYIYTYLGELGVCSNLFLWWINHWNRISQTKTYMWTPYKINCDNNGKYSFVYEPFWYIYIYIYIYLGWVGGYVQNCFIMNKSLESNATNKNLHTDIILNYLWQQ